MNSDNLTLLVDARTEYTKQLVNILKPNLLQGIKSIYNEVKEESIKNNEEDNILINFQNSLSKIPKWSTNFIDLEYNRILESSQCDWIDDLITAVFISHTKVLTIVQRKNNMKKKTNIKVPKSAHFIHLCYIECAREFWKNPYLFSEKLSQYEYQRNLRDVENMISESIIETVRKQLPVKTILKEYLGNDYSSDVEDDEDITKNMSDKQTNKLKEVLKKEIESNKDILDINDNDSESRKDSENENNDENEEDDIEIDLDLEEVNIETSNEETNNLEDKDNSTEESAPVEESASVEETASVEESAPVEETNQDKVNEDNLQALLEKELANNSTENEDNESTMSDNESTISDNESTMSDNESTMSDNESVKSNLEISEIDDLDLEIDELTEMDSDMSDLDLEEEANEKNISVKSNEFSFFN